MGHWDLLYSFLVLVRKNEKVTKEYIESMKFPVVFCIHDADLF